MKHLPPQFTWQDYLDWAQAVAPDAPFKDVEKLFTAMAAEGVFSPHHINERHEFVYELHPEVAGIKIEKVRVAWAALSPRDYKPERDD